MKPFCIENELQIKKFVYWSSTYSLSVLKLG